MLNLTKDNFAQEVLQSSSPVLVDFWAPWCSPCRALTPILDELAKDYDGRVKVGKVNTDEQQELAAQYRISAIPALLLFINGQVADQINGLHSKRDLQARIDRAAGQTTSAAPAA
jgi:thioredoxin 1